MTAFLFFLTAFAGGALNAVAGGGSFLLFPVLMMGGMGAVAANVMCSIALWPASVASAIVYFRSLGTKIATLKWLIVISVVGAALGSGLLLAIPEATFSGLVPWLLLAATLMFTFGRQALALLHKHHVVAAPIAIYAGMLTIAVYGGYFGAGIGILMLALLQLMGHTHMHEMNALKTVLGSAINAVAVVVFIASGAVVWEAAPVLIAGGLAGGVVGTRLALRLPPENVRRVVILVAWAVTTYFFIHG